MATDAKTFLVGIDLSKQELRQAKLQNLASAPSSPTTGQMYYDTVLINPYIYNGTTWVAMSATGTAPTPATTTSLGNVQMSVAPATAAIPIAVGTNDPNYLLAHTQNTDTGTTAASFQIASGATGPRIKNNSTTLDVRNSADSAYANVGLATLNVNTSISAVPTALPVVNKQIELNTANATNAGNGDAVLNAKRFAVDNVTRKDASLKFVEASGRWTQTFGPTATVVVAAVIPAKITASLGDGTSLNFTIVHNLGSLDVVCAVRTTASSPYDQVDPVIQVIDTNTVKVYFNAPAPSSGQYQIAIIG